MFVARRPLNLGNGLTAQPGEVVPQAADWSQSVIYSHVQCGMLEEVPDDCNPEDFEFISGANLTVQRNGKLVTVVAGEHVPEAADWSEEILRAHLVRKLVKKVFNHKPAVKEEALPAEEAKATPPTSVIGDAKKMRRK